MLWVLCDDLKTTGREIFLHLPENICISNLAYHYFLGEYAGFDETQPTAESGGKGKVISHLKEQFHFKKVVMIGDGATDMEACPPGVSITAIPSEQILGGERKVRFGFFNLKITRKTNFINGHVPGRDFNSISLSAPFPTQEFPNIPKQLRVCLMFPTSRKKKLKKKKSCSGNFKPCTFTAGGFVRCRNDDCSG